MAFLVLLAAPLPGLSPQAHALAAITVLTVILWIARGGAAGGRGLARAGAGGGARGDDAADALAPIASPLIFLFMGGFMLALGLAEQGLDRRATLWLLGRNALLLSLWANVKVCYTREITCKITSMRRAGRDCAFRSRNEAPLAPAYRII